MSTAASEGSATARALAWWARGACGLLADARRRWYLYLLLGAAWTLAMVRVFVHPTPVLPILFNWTPSLPYRVAYVEYGARRLARGDTIVYSFSGEAGLKDYPGLRHQPFFKRIVGVPGDTVSVDGRDVFVNGVYAGTARPHTKDRRPLQPIAATVIPPGKLYVQGTSPDSFDSRYRSSGLVDFADVVAKVRPVF